jgi:hypothetical protein
MDSFRNGFASLSTATNALYRIREPLILARFAPDPAEWEVVAVNQAAAMIDALPKVGDHPNGRRDREITPDLELEYLYSQLIERGHAQQVISLDGGHLYELIVHPVIVAEDEAIYGFITVKLCAGRYSASNYC